MAKRKTVDEKLAELDRLADQADAAARAAGIEAALHDRHYRIAAKAAQLAADALLYERVPELAAAYVRFLNDPIKTDPNCFAKKAILRALVTLDCGDSEIFRDALRYRQLEPVWGGSADTAAEVRTSAAMGLVASGYPRALVEIAELLYDAEPEARIGAVRAIACGGPREAELLLRGKVFSGDTEPTVIGEAFAALLEVAPEDSLALVARHLAAGDEAVREWAALTLGESRLEAAVAALRMAWDDVLVAPSLRRMLVRAAALNRSRAADDWLLELAETANDPVVDVVAEELAAYHAGGRLGERLEAALADRGRADLVEMLAERGRPTS